MAVQLHDHQQTAVDELHNGCILYGGVGTGKSITAMAYFVSKVCKGTYNDYGSMREPRDVYVITTAKKRDGLDWEQEALGFGITELRETSPGGIKLTVDSWNNIERYKDVSDAFFIFDEQRVVGSGSWSKAFVRIAKRNEWVLLSATPGDTWLDYIPVFVANGWYKNRTQFKQDHVVYNTFSKFPKVDHYVNVGKLVKYRNQVLVHMPYDRHTVRHSKTICVDYDVETYDKVVNKRWHVYEKRPLRDVAELFSVMRKVVNSDSSRLDTVRNLSQKHPKLIVFYNFDYELLELRKLSQNSGLNPIAGGKTTPKKELRRSSTGEWVECPEGKGDLWMPTQSSSATSATSAESTQVPSLQDATTNGAELSILNRVEDETLISVSQKGVTENPAFTVAEWNGHKHQPVPTTDRWVYLVQYTAGSEGWNCVSTDAMCFYSLTYSYKAYVQAHGRIDRLNTAYTDLWYYTLVSRASICRAILGSLKSKKSFNELKSGLVRA